MSTDLPIGSFFHVSLEEIHTIAEKSGNADCVLAMIALRRGQGRKANTSWGRSAIKKHMGLPHSRALNAIDWLLENKFFKEGKRQDDVYPYRALPEIGHRIYLPNLLVDNVNKGEKGGPLGRLMRDIVTDMSNKITTDQARLDAILVLIALYKQHQHGKARQDLVWEEWHTVTAKGKARSLTMADKKELCVLSAKKEGMQFNPNEAKKAFGQTCANHEITPRIALAIKNLKALGLAYSLTSVSRLTKASLSGLENRYETAYVLHSDFGGQVEPLGVSPLKELVREFSEHLNSQASTHLSTVFVPENIEFISFKHQLNLVRSTIEPMYVPNNEDLAEISANLNQVCHNWSRLIRGAIDNDLIMH
jgi:hypothetical protein